MENTLYLPNFNDVLDAANRINSKIHETPLLSSALLNHWLGHEITFKTECLVRLKPGAESTHSCGCRNKKHR